MFYYIKTLAYNYFSTISFLDIRDIEISLKRVTKPATLSGY